MFCWCLFVFNNNIKTNTNTQKCYKLKTKTTDQPPIGFIYASTAPPPYPGLPPSGQQVPQYPPPGGPPQQQHPPPAYNELGYPSANTYPGQQPAGPYPTPMAAPGPYPTSATGPTPTPANSNPIQHAHNANYPNQPASVPAGRQPSMGYPLPEQQAPSNQPQNPPPSGFGGYPSLPGNNAPNQTSSSSAWPTAPSYNPEWDDKKQA